MSDDSSRPTVAVADPDPQFRERLLLALRARGFEALAPANPVAQAADARGRALVITVRSAADWRSTGRAAAAGARVICLLARPSTLLYVRAYRSGAAGACPRERAVTEIADFVAQALAGDIVIPVAALKLLACGGSGSAPGVDALTAEDRSLLQDLVDGRTAGQMAAARGLSERTLYRRLGELYERLQVQGRHEGVQLAISLRLVSPAPPLHLDVTDPVTTPS